MKKIFPLLGLLGASAAAAPLPLISNRFTHRLPYSQACIDLKVLSVDSDDPALNRFTDTLLESEIAGKFSFDRAGLEKWLDKDERALLSKGGPLPKPREWPPRKRCRSYEISLVQTGEGAHYRHLHHFESANHSRFHKFDRYQDYVIPKAAPFAVLTLQDITLPGREQQLEQIQQRAFRRQLHPEKHHDAAELAEKIKTGAHFQVIAWRPTRDGLVFDFSKGLQHGHEWVTVPAAELKEVLKPEFLAELAGWQETEPERDAAGEYKATPKPNWRGQ